VGNLLRASKDVDESSDRFNRAEDMLHAVAGVPAPDRATAAATVRYPSLVIAEGRFYRAVAEFESSEPKEIKRHLAQVQKAAADLRAAWAAARDDAKGSKL
jgi:hypothetical protein